MTTTMHGNRFGNLDDGQFIMDKSEIEQFRRGMARVRRHTNSKLTSPFQVGSQVTVTPHGQQGIITVSMHGTMQMQFNITPIPEMFEGEGAIDTGRAEEISTDISAAVLSAMLSQTNAETFPAQ